MAKEKTPSEFIILNKAAGGALPLIDVREVDEFKTLRAPNAKLHPLSVIANGDLGPIATLDKDKAVYIICRSGARSGRVCAMLESLGFKEPINIAGGMIAWQAAGLETNKG